MTKDKNNFPTYFEELKIEQKQELNFQEILAQFKQQMPTNFIQIEFQEGNYCGSTNPKWKDKPVCERYGFTQGEEWIQLDIPHSLMEKLGLEKGKDINQPVYTNPETLTRKASYGGITIKNETEIILVNPNKILVKEIEMQTELSGSEIAGWEERLKDIQNLNKQIESKDEQINQLIQQVEELSLRVEKLETEKGNLNEKYNQLRMNTSNILCIGVQNFTPAITDMDLITQVQEVVKKLSDLKRKELTEKEKQLLEDFSEAAIIMGGVKGYHGLDYHEKKNKKVEEIREIRNRVEKIWLAKETFINLPEYFLNGFLALLRRWQHSNGNWFWK